MGKSLPDDSRRKTGSREGEKRTARDRSRAPRRSGRRPGNSGTREAILAAAQRQFAELGYDRSSLRSIAAAAGVDQRLVQYFFGSKQKLFVAAVDVPFDPRDTILPVLEGQLDGLGERLARAIVGVLEDPVTRARVVGIARAAATEPATAEMVRGIRDRALADLREVLADALGDEEADLRLSLLNSQFLGLVMARYIVQIEPLASLPPDQLVACLAPALQHCVSGPIPSP
jgi:AcrR family transcriptional regulator